MCLLYAKEQIHISGEGPEVGCNQGFQVVNDGAGLFQLHEDHIVEVAKSCFTHGIGRNGVDRSLQICAGIQKLCGRALRLSLMVAHSFAE